MAKVKIIFGFGLKFSFMKENARCLKETMARTNALQVYFAIYDAFSLS